MGSFCLHTLLTLEVLNPCERVVLRAITRRGQAGLAHVGRAAFSLSDSRADCFECGLSYRRLRQGAITRTAPRA